MDIPAADLVVATQQILFAVLQVQLRASDRANAWENANRGLLTKNLQPLKSRRTLRYFMDESSYV